MRRAAGRRYARTYLRGQWATGMSFGDVVKVLPGHRVVELTRVLHASGLHVLCSDWLPSEDGPGDVPES